MDLNRRQHREFREALLEAFGLDDLRLLVSDELDTTLEMIVADGGLPIRVQEVIRWARRRDQVPQLLNGARERRPQNTKLATLAEELGLASTGVRLAQPIEVDLGHTAQTTPGTWVSEGEILAPLKDRGPDGHLRIELQRVVQERGAWLNPGQFRERLAQRERQVCRVVVGSGGGTGFLVAPNLVLTNHHVITRLLDGRASPLDAHCLFDFRALADGTPVHAGRRVALHREWLVDSSPPAGSDLVVGGAEPDAGECDYAFLRLAEPIGDEPLSSEHDAPVRGWLPVADPPPAAASGHEVFVLQHPKQRPLALTLGRILGYNAGGNRLRHDANTQRGSSGSPCLNANLELIALHHAGDPDYDPQHRPEYNQAVPMAPIVQLLKQRAVKPVFWDSAG